ncbi:lytic transglycosylase, partial [Streptomyces sp. SID6648]|nr:lytic transglycosylase [Streptomyces sp. SID6648]
MSANGLNRHARTGRLARKLAVAGTGAAVLALPLIGATTA